MHVQYNLFLLSRMHSRKHIPACARVYLCVCTMRSLKFHTQPPPPPQGRPPQGEQSLCAQNPLPKGCCASPRRGADRLMAAAGSDHHVAVLLEDDVGAVVEVEHRDGVELRGGAAGFGNRVRVDEVNLEGGVSNVRRRRVRPALPPR